MALLLKFDARKKQPTNKFRFENMWLRDDKFLQLVEQSWQEASAINLSYADRLKFLQQKISQWNRHHFGNVQFKVKRIKAELETIYKQARNDTNQQREEELISELEDWLQREEILWKQRARVTWLEEGDNNTRYFHTIASSRKKSNTISRLEDQTGRVETDPRKITSIITDHYKRLFNISSFISAQELHTNLQCLKRKITDPHNAILLASYTAAEVTQAMFQLHPWQIVKDHFINDCLLFLNDGIVDNNVTMITLIPKQIGAIKVTDFRPISLIGTKMKVIATVLVNRLHLFLNEIVTTVRYFIRINDSYSEEIVPKRGIRQGRKAGVHWIKADTLRQPKDEGGLGFYNVQHLNLAFLSKQAWRLGKNPELLAARLLKAKYFHNSHIQDAQITARPSHIWRALFKVLHMLRYGCRRDPHTGDLTWKLE
ncbi:hypothetical protein QQ045_022676 [Rhodiola kirilowii]